MKRLILIFAALALFTAALAQTQQEGTPAEPEYDVFESLSQYVTVHQSP